MHTEIQAAISFLTLLIKPLSLSEAKLNLFQETLRQSLETRYSSCWYPEDPLRGSAYRALTTFHGELDQSIQEAVTAVDHSRKAVERCLPRDFVIWVDHGEVSYRLGDKGSVCVIYDANKNVVELKEPKVKNGGNNSGNSLSNNITSRKVSIQEANRNNSKGQKTPEKAAVKMAKKKKVQITSPVAHNVTAAVVC